jgi:iron(III) transport system permease protein
LKLRTRFKHFLNIWSILSIIFVIGILLPNIDLLTHVFQKPNENWYHIQNYLLKDYIINTVKIVIPVAFLAMIIGTSIAWLISAYNFPFRKFFKWALVLPIAIPPYIAAYTYTGMLSYTGWIQSFIRNTLNLEVNAKYFDMMSIKGAIFIFTIGLFPYVYMITRAFLQNQSATLIESARLLGSNSIEIFLYIILPLCRGAIIGGTSLVILEVLNDYGVVSYFGIPTLSTAIFKTWFGMGDIESAVKLSGILMLFVFGILLVEIWVRGRKKYSYATTKVRPIVRKELKGIYAGAAFMLCFVVISLGFVIPTLQLFQWSLLTYKKILNMQFVTLLFNSLWTAVLVSIIVVAMSIIIANFCRMQQGKFSKILSKITLIGYSIPAAVIAIGVILFFISLDNRLQGVYKLINPDSQTLVLSTSILMLLFAYIMRFLAIGYQSIEAGFEKVGKSFFEASRMLGKGVTKTFFKVDLPMLKPAVLSAFALTFVDVIKELPLTLILRPFNFHTLATKTFEYANDEMIHEASISSLLIIIVSFISIYFLYKTEKEEI